MTCFLLFIAAVGPASVIYFATEGRRARATADLARAAREWEQAQEEADRLELEADRLERAGADQRAAAESLRRGEEVYRRRAVSYDDLAAENRLLKTELSNLLVQLDHADSLAALAGSAGGAAVGQRDQLGRDYFEAERRAAERAVTPGNYPATKRRLQAVADRVRASGVDLPAADADGAFAELQAVYEKAVRAAAEREQQAEVRERMRDEARRAREAEDAVERAERERAAVAAALERALADVAGQHAAEVDRLRAQLAEAEAKSAKAVSQAQLTKKGTVYVISNPGAFGRDVFKIGMTRRLEPMDRVHELGDASVPFPFDVHLMVGCDDAPKLEACLHRRFHTRRVNKVNLRKEFFRVPVGEIAAAVRAEHGEVQYTADAEALEFLQSQTMTDAELAEVERAYAAADAALGVPAGGEPE